MADQPWPPFRMTAEDEHNALVEALTLLRRWRMREAKTVAGREDYRLFSETGHFCMVAETALGMDEQNPPQVRTT
jgi:hypothetical protein